jgi:hypothetical protein
MPSPRMWLYVALLRTNVSEEHISAIKKLIIPNILPSKLILLTFMMEITFR